MISSSSYQFRESVLTEINVLSLSSNGLASRCGGHSKLYAYTDIKSVRLKYDPTRLQTNRYLMDIEFHNAAKLRITNSSYAGFADFKDESDSYREFVTHFHQILSTHTDTKYLAGANTISYVFSLLCTFFILGILVFASIYLLLTGMFLIVLVKLVLIVVYLPSLFRYLKANRSRQYEPDNIPTSLLPE